MPTNSTAQLVAYFAGLLLLASTVAIAQRQVPLATDADRALAPLEVSLDGREFTFRGAAGDELRICVEPSPDRFGRRVCFTVGDVRRGRVRVK